MRSTKEFQTREAFEIQADALHDAFLDKRGITEEVQLHGHHAHLQASLMRTDAREPTYEELQDLEAMLQQHGVAPVSDSVLRWGQARVGHSAGGGLWTIVSSVRADKAAKDLGDKKKKDTSKANTSSSRLANCLYQSSLERTLLRQRNHRRFNRTSWF